MARSLNNFLDENGRLTQWPSHSEMKNAAVEYLASKFEPNITYSEKEVNALLNSWHTFNDYFILRRSLVERGLLLRKNDGSAYWKAPDKDESGQNQ